MQTIRQRLSPIFFSDFFVFCILFLFDVHEEAFEFVSRSFIQYLCFPKTLIFKGELFWQLQFHTGTWQEFRTTVTEKIQKKIHKGMQDHTSLNARRMSGSRLKVSPTCCYWTGPSHWNFFPFTTHTGFVPSFWFWSISCNCPVFILFSFFFFVFLFTVLSGISFLFYGFLCFSYGFL